MSNTMRLEGKVAFITGAARGQGRAAAVRLARDGADIIGIDVCTSAETTLYPGATPDDLAETARLVEAEGRRAVTVVSDVRDFEGLSAAVAQGVGELGRLDVVVANAGICTAAMSWEVSLEQWKETVDINLTGVFHTMKATIPVLLEQGQGGSVVITSSTAGLRGAPFLSHYAATKHGVVGLARSIANEVGMHDIRVNTVHPHGVETDMTVPELYTLIEKFPETLAPIFMSNLPYRKSEPDDIANAIAFLASDEARHVTGVALPVDLGTLIR